MFGNCCSTPGNLSVGRTCGLVNSDSFEMQEIPLFPHSDQALISEHSARIFDDSMDVDHLPFSELTGDSSLIFESSRRHMSESLQVSAGLVRYHSAPSSMLGGLVDDYFLNDLDPLGQVAGGGFTQLLADDLTSIGRSNTGCDTTVLQKADSMQKGKVLHEVHGQEPKQPCSEQGDTKKVVHLQPRFRKTSRKGLGQDDTSLSAILEYSQEGYSDSFCSSQTSASCTQEGMCTGHLLAASIAPVTTSESRSNLVRHSSLPAGLLSYLAMEARSQLESSEGPNCLSRPHRIPNKSSCNSTGRDIPAFAVTNNLNAGVPNKKIDPDLGRLEKYPSSSKRGLSRQSSLPAGLFSQLSLQAILRDGNELALPLTSETRMQGVHNSAMLAARKQIIELDAKKLPGSKFSDCLAPEAVAPVSDQLTLPTNSPDSQLMIDNALSDAVLCRARAKRGCATHPRSIAERVRRSKISERMKKLQELVPNMDKQANTAEMLDEAVEYIKFLQRQVQELSENQAKCDGSCMHKKTT